MTAIKNRWNERHYRLSWRYKEMGTYREVANVENISPQAVCDALKTSRALDVKAAEESLMEFFEKYPLCDNQSSDELLLEDNGAKLR